MARRGKLHVATKCLLLVVGGSALLSLVQIGAEPAFIARTFYLLAQDAVDFYLLNWVEFAVFVGCTLFVVEGFLRRRDNLWQFTLQELLMLMTAVAMTTSVLVNEGRLCAEAQAAYQEKLASGWYICWWDVYCGPPIYPLVNSMFCIPLAFGLLCIAYTATWLAWRKLEQVCSWGSRVFGIATTASHSGAVSTG
jgi:hypothetical protein